MAALAEAYGVTPRTLRNWKRLDPAEQVAPPGRPPVPEDEWRRVRTLVEAELERQGWSAGEGPVHRALGGTVPISRVRRALKELKKERRRAERERLAEQRVEIRILARDAVWSMDATHLGRNKGGCAVEGEVVREVRSTRTIGLSVGPSATAEDVVRLLERVAEERGGYPLLLITDNGGAYRSRAVAAWCRAHGVHHIFTLPRTPQHNAASEHGMRELKEDAALGKGTLVNDIGLVYARLVQSRDRIDENRLRKTRGWMTAVEYDHASPHWETLVSREDVYRKASCAIKLAVLDSTNKREERLAVREAILGTLEHFSVITRTRGGRPWSAHKVEDV